MRKKIDGRMPCRYTIEKDVVDRLSGCLFMFDGRVRMIEAAGGQNINIYDNTRSTFIECTSVKDDRLDISSIELGYVNIEDVVYYLERNPYKKYNQGLNVYNVMAMDINGDACHTESHRFKDGKYKNIIWTKEFEDSILGVFPKMSSMFDSSNKIKELAISQEIALELSDLDLVYASFRGETIGYMDEEGVLKIPSRRTSWVVESLLERNGISCRVKTGYKIPEE